MRHVPLRRLARNKVVTDAAGERPLVTLDAVVPGGGCLVSSALTMSAAEQNIAAEPGDVLFAKLRPYLRKSFAPRDPVFASGEFLCLRPVKDVHTSWLLYTSLSDPWIEHSVWSTYGAKMPRTSWDQMADLVICTPAVDEQRRIAGFLDDQVPRIDRVADGHRKQWKLIEQRRAAALDALVTGKNESELDVAAWAPFGRVPKAWRARQLRSVRCAVQTGPFGSQLHRDDYVEDGWPVVNPANLKMDGIVSLPEMMVDDATRERLNRHVLAPGDVVFGRRGELGRAGLVGEQQSGWLCGTGSLRVRLTGVELDPRFLLRLLRTSAIRYYFETQAVGSTMANLNTGILMAMPILLPPPAVQRALVQQAEEIESAHDDVLALLRAQIRLLQERKQALITSAVTGAFDVSTASTRATVAVTG